jgi:dodecin
MSVAKVTELTSESTKSFEDAIHQGLSRASRTLHGIQGAWVSEQKVVWSGDRVSAYRVTMKVTFVLKD